MIWLVITVLLCLVSMIVVNGSMELNVDKTIVDFADLLYPCSRLRPASHNSHVQHHKKVKSHREDGGDGHSGDRRRTYEEVTQDSSPLLLEEHSHFDEQLAEEARRRLFWPFTSSKKKEVKKVPSQPRPSGSITQHPPFNPSTIQVHHGKNPPPHPLPATFKRQPPQKYTFHKPTKPFGKLPAPAPKQSTPATPQPPLDPLTQQRLKHIEPIQHIRHEMSFTYMLEELSKYSSFKQYLQENTNLETTSTGGESTTTTTKSTTHAEEKLKALKENFASNIPANVWKPSFHQPPYAFYDTQTHHTRLTWCENDHSFAQNNDFLWNSMKNRRIVFIGDSVTRYQYLDLLYFLTHKKWNRDLKLVNEKLFHDWNEFFVETNRQFNTNQLFPEEQYDNKNATGGNHVKELCECYRSTCCGTWHLNENRKYYNRELNTTIWFFTWFGEVSMPHGHFNWKDDIQPLDCMPNNCHSIATNHSWIADSVAEFLYIFALTHRPDHIIINTGLHTPLDGKNGLFAHEAKLWRKYILLLQEAQELEDERNNANNIPNRPRTKLVYKSVTTQVNDMNVVDNRELDFGAMQLALHGIWDYWDISSHLYELYIVYRKLETAYQFYHGGSSSTSNNSILSNNTVNNVSSNSNSSNDNSNSSSLTLDDVAMLLNGLRGFGWDNTHFVPWVYREINKMMIMKYFNT